MAANPRWLAAGSSAVVRTVAARRDRLFFGGMTVALFASVLLGFGPSYYFSTLSSSTVILTPALHVHGAAFTMRMVLLVVYDFTMRGRLPPRRSGAGCSRSRLSRCARSSARPDHGKRLRCR
jgi:hypothetical protein